MKIGIFGGTFDPVHLAHLVLAETCLEFFELDQVRFVPASTPPHKQEGGITSAKQRIAMLEFATAGIPEFVVDQRETKRGGVNFTCETLAEFRSEFPEDELFFLMGSDSLHDLPTWKEPETIASLATIVAVNRGPISDEQMQSFLAPLSPPVKESVRLVSMPGIEIASRDLRERVTNHRSIRFLTPRPVERYILENGVYQD